MFQPQQDTASLPLPPAVRGRLLAAGFATAGSLRDVGVAVLAREAGLSHEEALAAVRLVPAAQGGRVGATEGTGAGSAIGDANAAAGSGPAAGGAGTDGPPERTYVGIRGARSALEILAAEESRAHVLTFCGELDRLLGGGVPAGEVTEFCGVPGVGKTQLSMQLCLDVQIPVAFGGVGGRAVYIDTEGSFMVERIEQMARACVAHLQRMASVSRNPAMAAAAAGIDAHELLANIFYFRAHTATEQIAAINMLDSLAAEQQNVRLVVVDSIAFHFRQEYTDFARRTRVLNALAQQLLELAERRAVAVVLVNQVTTRVSRDGNSEEDNAKLVPALGDSWAHTCTNRVILFWEGSERRAHLYKSPRLPVGTASYDVTADGVRGVRRTGTKRPLPES